MSLGRPGRILLFSILGLAGLALIGSGSWMLLSPMLSDTPTLIPTMEGPSGSSTPFTETPLVGQPTETEIIVKLPSPTAVSFTAETATQAPISTLTPSLTPTAWLACPNTYYSHLRVGMKAKVAEEPPLPNRMRERADVNSTIIGMIQPGEEVEILDGPGCSNNWVWWKVRTSDGLTGWTVEGDGGEYWLIPVKP